MPEYRKLPVVIQAELYDGSPESVERIKAMVGATGVNTDAGELHIFTLEGTMRADKGDYVIKGVKGEPYPCKPDVFLMTYEGVCDEKQKSW